MINILLSGVLPILLVGVGAFFLFYLKGYPFRRPKKLSAALFSKEGGGRQALLTALAGTLGVGNISGVALAVTLGGAGALFWMWVCAFFAMILKYAEIVLALGTKQRGHGGAMYYIKGRLASVLFALICIACGFSMGNMTQVRAASEAVGMVFGGERMVALAFALTLPAVILRGKKGVFQFAEKVIPILTLGYCLLAGCFLFLNRSALPDALRQIFSSAFSVRAFGGGIMGCGMLTGLRYGAVRGMISNEAGCGTAPIAHAASENPPAAQGCLGIAEVGIDTLLLCTLTGLSVLVVPIAAEGSGTAMVIAAFATQFGKAAGGFLAPAMAIFAFATVVCWFFYTSECMRFLAGSDRYEKPLVFLFSIACLAVPFFREETLFLASDILICLMALLNLPALVGKRKSIRENTLRYFQ